MIRFLVMDVDGTLTDGKIYMGNSGEMFKAFNIKDGYGIYGILPELNIIPVIITARESMIVENRFKELNVKEIHQGCHAKLDKLNEILKRYSQEDGVVYDLSNVAYIGDDLLDMQCIEPIKNNGGFTASPADAADDVKSAVNYVCQKNAGEGAVREFIQYLKSFVQKRTYKHEENA